MHSPDAPRARRGPGPPARGLGSTPGSPPWTASGVDSLPCSLDDTHSPSSSADGERCVGRVGIIARNCDTCAVFECSSAASFQPPMMARPCTITPSNRTRRRTRSRTEEDGLQNPLEENVIEENRTFTPADLLLFQNGDGISFYRLLSAGAPESPVEQICNPGGDPAERRWIEYLTKGDVVDRWRHERFVRIVEGLFPEGDGPPQPASPLLETIAVITARHAPSGRANEGAKPAHLIVISDLLQHTPMLSHYGPYPEPDSLPRELRADLSRVEVSLFRLERHKYAKFQTPEHYYWWTELVEEMEGRIVWQQAL